jgi:hypothetical protein
MENYSLFALLLLFLGIGILLSEVVIPSAGLLSFMALSCFVGSGICAYNAWYVTGKMVWWWGYVFGIVFIIPSSIAATMYYLPRTKLGKELFAAPPSLEELIPFANEEKRLILMIDETGIATTLFSPGGMAQIGREKFHAEAEGMMIEPNTEIIVIGVKGNRLLVRPLSMHPTQPNRIEEPSALDNEVASSHDSTDEPGQPEADGSDTTEPVSNHDARDGSDTTPPVSNQGARDGNTTQRVSNQGARDGKTTPPVSNQGARDGKTTPPVSNQGARDGKTTQPVAAEQPAVDQPMSDQSNPQTSESPKADSIDFDIPETA